YVLDKMKQNINFDLDFDSNIKNEEIVKQSKGIKKLWRGVTKGFNQPKVRASIEAELKSTGYAKYRESFNDLISHVNGMPEIKYFKNEKGEQEPIIKFFDVPDK